ncbi:Acetyltransferase (GNAT) domain protein [uncultured archaeon]|nr:Acetyltransferase (GNAT) domain protein [uncultured archaeon]
MRRIITGEQTEDGRIIQIRKAVKEDIPNLIKLFKETILDVYGQILPGEVLEPWVEGDRLAGDVNSLWQYMIVAEKAGDIVAAAARYEDMIALIWVHPAYHRKGIGSALLDIVETELVQSGYRTAKLECFSDNVRAMGFYRAKGWKALCEVMDEEAGALKMVMTKALKIECR